MSKREAIEFTNDVGQVIRPGDEVIVVTHCTGRTNTTKGVYVGMLGKSVQAMVERGRWTFFFKGTDTAVQGGYFDELYKSGFKYNSPEYKELHKRLYDAVEMKSVKFNHITTLQYNRVYKLAS